MFGLFLSMLSVCMDYSLLLMCGIFYIILWTQKFMKD